MCWWCLGRVSVMCSDCVVMFWWYVGDALVLCWWCLCSVSVMLWCLSDGWWCCGDVLVMVLWCFGDEHWWTFSEFQWVPKQKEWLLDVSLLLGSYAGLIYLFIYSFIYQHLHLLRATFCDCSGAHGTRSIRRFPNLRITRHLFMHKPQAAPLSDLCWHCPPVLTLSRKKSSFDLL